MMKMGPGYGSIRGVGQVFDGATVAGMGEVQLLERFIARRDEPAFAALVARFGPMVLGVCRRHLDDPLDVEDAFQATFLVLVRRAGSIRDRDRISSWLFGVARRVSIRARRDRSRRQARERLGLEVAAEAPRIDENRAELGRVLVEEIDRLPGSLRLAVVLCCLDGLSYEEAADRLGSSSAAIRGRLSRARERLRGRLTRRGFAPASAAVGVGLATEAASAAVPISLIESTTRVAIVFAAGRASTAGAVPAAVAMLAEGVIRTMMFTKSKILAMALVGGGLATTGVGVLGQAPAQSPNEPVSQPFVSKTDRLGEVEQKLDRLLHLLERPSRDAPARDPFHGDQPPATASDPFVLRPDAPPRIYESRKTERRAPIDQDEAPTRTRAARSPDAAPSSGMGGMGNMMGSKPAGSLDRISSRLTDLERGFERLEGRMNALEEQVRSNSTINKSRLPSPASPFNPADNPDKAEGQNTIRSSDSPR